MNKKECECTKNGQLFQCQNTIDGRLITIDKWKSSIGTEKIEECAHRKFAMIMEESKYE